MDGAGSSGKEGRPSRRSRAALGRFLAGKMAEDGVFGARKLGTPRDLVGKQEEFKPNLSMVSVATEVARRGCGELGGGTMAAAKLGIMATVHKTEGEGVGKIPDLAAKLEGQPILTERLLVGEIDGDGGARGGGGSVAAVRARLEGVACSGTCGEGRQGSADLYSGAREA